MHTRSTNAADAGEMACFRHWRLAQAMRENQLFAQGTAHQNQRSGERRPHYAHRFAHLGPGGPDSAQWLTGVVAV